MTLTFESEIRIRPNGISKINAGLLRDKRVFLRLNKIGDQII